MVPLIANPEETEPKSEEIRKEMTRFLRLSKGRNNLAKVWKYYKPGNPSKWPNTERKEL